MVFVIFLGAQHDGKKKKELSIIIHLLRFVHLKNFQKIIKQ